MIVLSVIVWLVGALPLAMLIGYCTLSEELQPAGRVAAPHSRVRFRSLC
jgi:hypothetical protein